MSDFLLELRSEEIPARMQAGGRAELERLFRKHLAEAELSATEVTVWSTPRRLALLARGLPKQTAARSEEIKGPRSNAPPQAREGFLRKWGIEESHLVERDGILFATIEQPAQATAAILAKAIPEIVRTFAWPKSMRWGSGGADSLRWVRPLASIVALLDEEVVECKVDTIESGRETTGHPVLHNGKVTIPHPADYQQLLRAAHVLVDHSERADIIREGAANRAQEAGFALVADEKLVEENAGLCEWPVPLLGRFDADYLRLPPEVIRLTARTHQKYFVVQDKSSNLTNGFICVADMTSHDGGQAIIAGNQRVLAARLADARFFYESDLKKGLDHFNTQLSKAVFHKDIGTLQDKVERIESIISGLVKHLRFPSDSKVDAEQAKALAKQAAAYCKADLFSEMVGEFPELQGIMGGYYAQAMELPNEVAEAIRDHYKPIGAEDNMPTAPLSVALAIADRIDTLAMFFLIGKQPTGSKDPFALRRAALGLIRLIAENNLRLPLHARFKVVASNYIRGKYEGADRTKANEQMIESIENLVSFCIERLKVQQRTKGVRHDIIDAVTALLDKRSLDIVDVLARVHALQNLIDSEVGTNLLVAYKRSANILEQAGWSYEELVYVRKQIPHMEEASDLDRNLSEALDNNTIDIVKNLSGGNYEEAMCLLANLRESIDAFFDGVLINDSDEKLRRHRLSLLQKFCASVYQVADFSRIEGAG